MKAQEAVIMQAVVSEKGSILRDKENRYVFKVHPDANKVGIKRAVEKAFNVKVLDVHTITMMGKTKRLGRFQGQRSSWKKAIVRLKQGDSIDIFEGV